MTNDEIRERTERFGLCDEDKEPTPEQMLEYLILMRELQPYVREHAPETIKRREEAQAQGAQVVE